MKASYLNFTKLISQNNIREYEMIDDTHILIKLEDVEFVYKLQKYIWTCANFSCIEWNEWVRISKKVRHWKPERQTM